MPYQGGLLRRAILLATIGLLLWPLRSPATGPEGAWGKYSYRSKDLNIDFLWDIDGIRDVKIDGLRYSKVLSAENENGDNFGSEGVFPFWISFEENEKELKRLNLLLLFNNGKLKCISGLYSHVELPNAQTHQFRIIQAKAIQLSFAPLQ